jgi:hypothetical protein
MNTEMIVAVGTVAMCLLPIGAMAFAIPWCEREKRKEMEWQKKFMEQSTIKNIMDARDEVASIWIRQ